MPPFSVHIFLEHQQTEHQRRQPRATWNSRASSSASSWRSGSPCTPARSSTRTRSIRGPRYLEPRTITPTPACRPPSTAPPAAALAYCCRAYPASLMTYRAARPARYVCRAFRICRWTMTATLVVPPGLLMLRAHRRVSVSRGRALPWRTTATRWLGALRPRWTARRRAACRNRRRIRVCRRGSPG